ncbi:Nitroreductase [Spironucleus salmonicida]|uniref:Nitroreductase n=1 Tax=Spironucleus salmonicida TaxID=348837 RepID=V6LVR2_9EUKA|nr:Nitroreductase [Spironucleus salmonicida]KAH0571977.1 Nitroreductase [Spironucleus salmonicida]|eukprot:EST44909.1 Nitroreductase [Spironucleus salmonicida]
MSIKILANCVGCQACYNICPTKAFQFIDKMPIFARPDSCMSCGHCYAICPVGAITIFDKEPDSEPLEPPHTVEGAIKFRRSVRRFAPQPLPKEFISDIIDITKFCPSARNLRPIRYVVLSRTAMDCLAEEIAKSCDSAFPGLHKLQSRFDVIFRGAQHCIVTYAEITAVSVVQDSAIQISTLELYCQNKGIGCVWIGFLTKACKVNPSLLRLMNLDCDHVQVLSCLGIGIPAIKYKRSVARKDEIITFRD